MTADADSVATQPEGGAAAAEAAVDHAAEPPAGDAGPRTPAAEMHRLIDELLPPLVSRLEASDLGEIDVREGAWRIRLRRSAIAAATPAAAPGPAERARIGRASAASRDTHRGGGPRQGRPGAQGSDAAKAAPGGATTSSARGGGPGVAGNGAHPALTAVGPGRTGDAGVDGATAGRADGVIREGRQRPVSSPAVGYYLPRDGVGPGHQVRSGDILGHVDVLGVRQEVVAPGDGIVARVLAQSGEAVEYGQELLRLATDASPRPERVP